MKITIIGTIVEIRSIFDAFLANTERYVTIPSETRQIPLPVPCLDRSCNELSVRCYQRMVPFA